MHYIYTRLNAIEEHGINKVVFMVADSERKEMQP
jgi:hypothetical protein